MRTALIAFRIAIGTKVPHDAHRSHSVYNSEEVLSVAMRYLQLTEEETRVLLQWMGSVGLPVNIEPPTAMQVA